MRHSEQARVVPLVFALTHPFRAQKKKRNAHTTRTRPPWLGVWFACSLWSAFTGLARSARLDSSVCSLNARGTRSPTNSALFIFQVSRFCRPRENSQQKRERLGAL